VARLVAEIARAEGFPLNPGKTRVMHTRGRQVVTGVVVNERLNPVRAEVERLEATLFNCVRHGPATQARGVERFREVLRGKIAWVAQVNAARGAKLLALYDRITW
jgi:hypothetical protein